MPAHDPELGEKQPKQQFEREIRDMMSTLTRRLAHLQKKPTTTSEGSGSASHVHEEELALEAADDHGGFGAGVITMAGSNEGATMRGEIMSMQDQHNSAGGTKKADHNSTPILATTYLNSNFQGVNNSMMVRGSYSANDPGIHLDIEDCFEQRLPSPPRKQAINYGKKKKQKASSGSSTSEQSS